jgi:hypothetical protein
MIAVHQWDIVKVRINPEHRDEHPAIVISPEEICADEQQLRLNVLYGTTRRPGDSLRVHEAALNGADGLDHAALFSCAFVYVIDRRKIGAVVGRVSAIRRVQLGRKIVAIFRFPLS